MDILTAFGQKIKIVRLKQGLSQEKLAELTGLHRTYVGGIERGERNISLKNVKRLADALNISLESLFKDL